MAHSSPGQLSYKAVTQGHTTASCDSIIPLLRDRELRSYVKALKCLISAHSHWPEEWGAHGEVGVANGNVRGIGIFGE